MDGARTIVNLLKGHWDSNNAGEIPEISLVYDIKRIDLGQGESAVLVYQVATTENINTLSATTKEVTERITIDIRTTVSRDRLISIEREIRRILETFATRLTDAVNPGFIWDLVQPQDSVDRSDKTIKLYRYTMDCILTSYATPRSTYVDQNLQPTKKTITIRVAHNNPNLNYVNVDLWLCDETQNPITKITDLMVRYSGTAYTETQYEIDVKPQTGVWYWVRARTQGFDTLAEYAEILNTTNTCNIIVRANTPSAGQINFIGVDATSEDASNWTIISAISLKLTIHNDQTGQDTTVETTSANPFRLEPYERIYRIEASCGLGISVVACSDEFFGYYNGIRVLEENTKNIFVFFVNKNVIPVWKLQIWSVVNYPNCHRSEGIFEHKNTGLQFNVNTVITQVENYEMNCGRNEVEVGSDTDSFAGSIYFYDADGKYIGGRGNTGDAVITSTMRQAGCRVLQFYTDYNPW